MSTGETFKNVMDIVNGIAQECKMLSLSLMSNAINDKTGEASLVDSNIYKGLEVDVGAGGDEVMINILVADYIDYIQGGRAPNKHFPWSIAISVLPEWASRRGIPTDNSTIYFIWKSIIEKGIKPRPIFTIPDGLWTTPSNDEVLFNMVDDYWDDWANEIFDAAISQIVDWFNS